MRLLLSERVEAGLEQKGETIAMRLLRPSLSDCLLILFMLLVFGMSDGWHYLLLDGDTGWHLKTGESILTTKSVPHTDPYSFTKPGQTWFAWEWLADVAFAFSHRVAGLKGVVFFSGSILGVAALTLFRYMLWRCAGVHIAVVLCILIVDSARIHFLARPHIFTLLLIPVCMWVLERDLERPSRRTWILVPIATLWTNLHGGFLFLISSLVIFTLAAVFWSRVDNLPQMWMRRARRLAGLTAACSVATLLNPYGYGLYIHLAAYLQSAWIKNMVEEFQSPQFRSESIYKFEALLFVGLCIVPALLRRGQLGSALLLLGWAHQALASIRHIPIYLFAAGPPIATELTVLWNQWTVKMGGDTRVGALRDIFAGLSGPAKSFSIWGPVFLVGQFILTPSSVWPVDFPEVKFPVDLVSQHSSELSMPKRILSSDSWGGYLIYRFSGKQKVFLDGRSDFYGEALGNDYICLRAACPQWSKLADRYGIDTILIPQAWPLASALRKQPRWRLVGEDKLGIWLTRELPGAWAGGGH